MLSGHGGRVVFAHVVQVMKLLLSCSLLITCLHVVFVVAGNDGVHLVRYIMVSSAAPSQLSLLSLSVLVLDSLE